MAVAEDTDPAMLYVAHQTQKIRVPIGTRLYKETGLHLNKYLLDELGS
jgi:hypothetical protein